MRRQQRLGHGRDRRGRCPLRASRTVPSDGGRVEAVTAGGRVDDDCGAGAPPACRKGMRQRFQSFPPPGSPAAAACLSSPEIAMGREKLPVTTPLAVLARSLF
jgi:hypothetical protein